MTRFIAMNVLSDETASIVVLLTTGIGKCEKLVQSLHEGFLSTHQLDEIGDILWHIPVVLSGITFCIWIATVCTIFQRVEWFKPFPVTLFALEEAIGRVE